MDIGVTLLQLETFFLIFVRITSLFIIAPFFGNRSVPVQFKVSLALFFSIVGFSGITVPEALSVDTTLPVLAFLVIKEMMVGLTLGYFCALIFSAIQVAGQFIDLQIGFGIANVIDPQTGFQAPLIGNLMNLLAMMLFMGLDGPHGLVTAILQSFQIAPLGTFVFSEGMLEFFFHAFAFMFLLALKISIPVVAALLLTDVALAIMSRTVPQMNIFVVGMPAKILIGFLMLIFAMPAIVYFLSDMFHILFRQLDVLIRMLGGAG